VTRVIHVAGKAELWEPQRCVRCGLALAHSNLPPEKPVALQARYPEGALIVVGPTYQAMLLTADEPNCVKGTP
jgi:hypothetical protein